MKKTLFEIKINLYESTLRYFKFDHQQLTFKFAFEITKSYYLFYWNPSKRIRIKKKESTFCNYFEKGIRIELN